MSRFRLSGRTSYHATISDLFVPLGRSPAAVIGTMSVVTPPVRETIPSPPVRCSRQTALVWLLRGVGLVDLLALWAVCSPRSQLAGWHAFLGLGTFPSDPIAEYLARTTSLFYAGSGALFWLLATDVIRYRPVIRFVAMAGILCGVGLIAIDWAAGLPRWWVLLEGPCCIVLGSLVIALQSRAVGERGDMSLPGD